MLASNVIKYLLPFVENEVSTITAKIWYVSDFHAKLTRTMSEQVDPDCVDNPTGHCERYKTGFELQETIPEDVINSWKEDTPHNRAQAVVNANIDYLNWAFANSDIPIRYIQWGSLQDIGHTDAQIGSGFTIPGIGATRSSHNVSDR